MRRHGVERCFTFPLNDPDRFPAYRVPNDRVLEWAAASDGALVPFCRLDLTAEPIAEAERCLDKGARGIKLHPRAQKFDFGERGLDPVFRLAAERRVPILIHAGRGLPAIAEDLQHLVEHHPDAQLILAHAAIADLQHIGADAAQPPQRALRHVRLVEHRPARAPRRQSPPSRSRSRATRPTARPAIAQIQVGTALQPRRRDARPGAGHHVGERRARRPRRVGAARSRRRSLARDRTVPLQRVRVHEYLIMATTLLWTRLPDTPGAVGLARRACDTNGSSELAAVEALLDLAQELWTQSLAIEDPDAARPYGRAAARTLQIADSIVLDV